MADFLMSIYLKIITEQKNKNPEKKWPSREKKAKMEIKHFFGSFQFYKVNRVKGRGVSNLVLPCPI